jgi:hypothetical protein
MVYIESIGIILKSTSVTRRSLSNNASLYIRNALVHFVQINTKREKS